MSEIQDRNQGFDLDELIEDAPQATQQSSAPGSAVGGILVLPTVTASTEADFNRQLSRVQTLLGLATNALKREIAAAPNLANLAGQEITAIIGLVKTALPSRIGVVQAIENANAVNKDYTKATFDFMFKDGAMREVGSNGDSTLRDFTPKFHQAALQLLYALFGTDKEIDHAVLEFIDTQGLIGLLINEISLSAYEQTMNSAVLAYAEAEEKKTGVRPGPFSLDKKLGILLNSGLHPKSQDEVISERPAVSRMFSASAESAAQLVKCAQVFFETHQGDEKRLQEISALQQASQELTELYRLACESK